MNQQLIAKYRDINVDYHGWWECVYSDFVEDMAAVGIRVERMYFSGFASQGDGACFVGEVDDWGLFLPHMNIHDRILIQHAENTVWEFSVKHSGYYFHENSTHFTDGIYLPEAGLVPTDGYRDEYIEFNSPYPADDVRSQAWLTVLEQYDPATLVDDFTERFKDHMRDLYRRLEQDYNYLTSDEVVWESIVANELNIEEEAA
jgi:hypothetical protein